MECLLPLPDCEGPKLEPFTQNFEDLKFEPELVIRDADQYVHGLVVKAKLDGKTYAIKFFVKQETDSILQHYPDLTEEESAIAAMQIDPFGAECRAYGRLKETGQEHLAAKAYGYVKVFVNDRTEEMFKTIESLYSEWQKWCGLADFFFLWDFMGPEFAGKPIPVPVMGIVKEWVDSGDHGWTRGDNFADALIKHQREASTFPRSLRNLHQLHKHGIVLRDIHGDQYVHGELVDLSCSWTFPHVLAQGDPSRPDWSSASYAARDLHDFQTNVIDNSNRNLDSLVEQSHKFGVVELPRCKKIKLFAYRKAGTREGLRQLSHRKRNTLPLLHYYYHYQPNSSEQHPQLVPWTDGPRFDPGQFRLNKFNERLEKRRAPQSRFVKPTSVRPKKARRKQ